MDFNGVYNEARPLKWSRLLFPDYWQWTTAKIPKIILRNIQVSARNCFKEQRHGFLLTFDWCRGQMMLISLKRNMAWCIVKWYNGQSMQLLLLPPVQPAHFWSLLASRVQSEGWLRWRQLVTSSRPRFLLIIPTYYMRASPTLPRTYLHGQ